MHAADVMHAASYLLHGAIADKIPPEELLVVPHPSSRASSPAGASSRCARLAPAGARREGSALGEGDAACGALARPRASWGKQRVPNSGQEPSVCPPPPISFPPAIPRSAPKAADRACRIACAGRSLRSATPTSRSSRTTMQSWRSSCCRCAYRTPSRGLVPLQSPLRPRREWVR